MNQCSDLFADVFDSGCGGTVRTCACGRTFYNYMDAGCFDPGELEDLEARNKVDPDKVCAVDHTVGTIEIAGQQIVHGCSCDTALKYEHFILSHAGRLATYLRRHAANLRTEAFEVDLSEETAVKLTTQNRNQKP